MFTTTDQAELKDKKAVSFRQQEIVNDYIKKLDTHIADLKSGAVERALEVGEFAEMMHIHPVHLSNTIKEVTGQSSCSLYEERLVRISKELVLVKGQSIKEIAMQLTYDPSNFTKFFKRFTGMSPKQFRAANLK